MKSEELMQSIRRSHCAAGDDRKHDCLGTCTITPDGIKLECKLCGGDSQVPEPKRFARQYDIAASILRVAGMDIESLSLDAQLRVVQKTMEMHCPHCDERVVFLNQYFRCKCGASWNEFGGWSKHPKIQ